MLETILMALFKYLIYPLALEIAMRRDADPVFKAASDEIYGNLKSASTTAQRMDAVRRMHELQQKA